MTAQDIVAQATNQLESILRLYFLRHSFEAYDPMLALFLVHLANLTLPVLEQLEQGSTTVPTENSEALLSTLILCYKGLHDQSKTSYVAGLILAVMKKRVGPDIRSAVVRHISFEEPGSPDSEVSEDSTFEHPPPILSDLVLPGASLSEDPKRWKLVNMAEELRRG
jgi:hypothetical protein